MMVEMLCGQIQPLTAEEISRPRKRNVSEPDAIEQLLGIGMNGRIEELAGLFSDALSLGRHP
jgi:hypothetical protein